MLLSLVHSFDGLNITKLFIKITRLDFLILVFCVIRRSFSLYDYSTANCNFWGLLDLKNISPVFGVKSLIVRIRADFLKVHFDRCWNTDLSLATS